ncbi:MAG TPA: chemotaxis protein CheX [Phycisphaerales bacterium]|nr:chemotaxis protein CheX [Phycisphaerales bacterium]
MIHQVKTAIVESIAELYDRMFSLDADAVSADTSPEESDLISETRLSGATEGTVSIRFPRSTARRLRALATGAEEDPSDADLIDLVNELTEMIVAGMRGRLGPAVVSASRPTVRFGLPRTHDAAGPQHDRWTMASDCGGIDIDAAIRSAPSLRFGNNQNRAAA